MSAEPVETLVERVRRLRAEGKGVQADVAMDAALTELAERLSRAEDAERLADQRYFEAIERLEAQGRKLSCGYDTGTGQNCGECLDCLKVNWHFAQEAVTNLRERLEAAERERDLAQKAIAAYDTPGGLGEVFAAVAVHFVEPAERRAEAAEARVAELEAALDAQWPNLLGGLRARVAALEEALRDVADVGRMRKASQLREIARAALRVEGDA